jgi:hypothetical protein
MILHPIIIAIVQTVNISHNQIAIRTKDLNECVVKNEIRKLTINVAPIIFSSIFIYDF